MIHWSDCKQFIDMIDIIMIILLLIWTFVLTIRGIIIAEKLEAKLDQLIKQIKEN
jgi:hypothetical protein